MKISRTMLDNLRRVEADPLRKPGQGEWTRIFYRSCYEPLVRRGLVEMADLEYQPPLRLEPHVRLTEKGRALLGSNKIEDHLE